MGRRGSGLVGSTPWITREPEDGDFGKTRRRVFSRIFNDGSFGGNSSQIVWGPFDRRFRVVSCTVQGEPVAGAPRVYFGLFFRKVADYDLAQISIDRSVWEVGIQDGVFASDVGLNWVRLFRTDPYWFELGAHSRRGERYLAAALADFSGSGSGIRGTCVVVVDEAL